MFKLIFALCAISSSAGIVVAVKSLPDFILSPHDAEFLLNQFKTHYNDKNNGDEINYVRSILKGHDIDHKNTAIKHDRNEFKKIRETKDNDNDDDDGSIQVQDAEERFLHWYNGTIPRFSIQDEGNNMAMPSSPSLNLPSYCDPPNPCPIGYTSKDGCIEEGFKNDPEFSRAYQETQNCLCDPEHSLNCIPNSNIVTDDDADGDDVVQPAREPPYIFKPIFYKSNPFLLGNPLSIAAKKGMTAY